MVLAIPAGVPGDFVISDMTSAKMNKFLGPTITEYEEMLQGIWRWSTDGEEQNAYIIFEENKVCMF